MNLTRNFFVTFPYQHIQIYIYKWLSKYIEKCYFAAIKIKKSVKIIIKKTCIKRDKTCVKKHLSQDFIEKSSKMQHSDRYNTTQASLPHVHSSSLKKPWNGINRRWMKNWEKNNRRIKTVLIDKNYDRKK